MAHVAISGVPSELAQAAIDWLNLHVFPQGHTGEVVDPAGERLYGHSAPEAPAEAAQEPTAQA